MIANSKGFDALGWFFYGALLFPIALAHVIVKPSRRPPVAPGVDPDDTKPCPQCAEAIKADAKVCRFCGNREFPEPETSDAEDAFFASLELRTPRDRRSAWQRFLAG